MSDERPEALLKSALEKIVYFEARSEQLNNDLQAARGELARLKQELGLAGQREIELRRHVAGLEVEVSRAHREREELGRVHDALRSERAALMEKILEAARIHAADGEEDQPFDLASFIAQLRSEVLSRPQEAQALVGARSYVAATAGAATVGVAAAPAVMRSAAGGAALVEAPVAAGPGEVARVGAAFSRASAVSAHAERLRVEGRLDVSEAQLAQLSGASSFPGRAEQTLFGFSLRELSAPDAQARVRASERLRALGQHAAAPALASALHSEREAPVLVALLSAFSELASGEGAPVVMPLLDSKSPDVRVAALKALLSLDATGAGPHLSAAMKDQDRAVRRRASLLALGLGGEAALALGEEAVRDEDAEVRSLGALVLGASGGERARELLVGAMRDPERKVRKSAASSLSRILGEDVSAVVDLDDAQRRREVRRLATLPARPVLPTAVPRPVARVAGAAAPPAVPQAVQQPVQQLPVVRVAQPASQPVPVPPSEALCGSLMTELRSAIRGRSLADLVSLTPHTPAQLQDACELLVARGHAVRRGQKYFAA